jgi:hypothetical protein
MIAFKTERPDHNEEYQSYAAALFLRANKSAEMRGAIGFVINCPEHGRRDVSWACHHVLAQLHDDRPNGVVEISFKYADERVIPVFLCRDCYGLFQRRRLNVGREVKTVCHGCVEAVVAALVLKAPDLYKVQSIQR